MLSPLLLAALLSQTAPTRAQVIGTLNTLEVAVEAARAGTRTYTQNAAKTRLCIQPATTIQPGSVTVRYGVVMLSPAAQRYLGFALPAGKATWAEVEDMHAALEVQAPEASTVTFDVRRLLANVDVLENEVEVRATPFAAACEVGIMRDDDPLWGQLVRCGCAATPATCTWNRPEMGGGTTPVTPAPTGMTFSPGTFSGAGCKAKPCVTRFDGVGIDRSWPAACPK